jgi:adenine-specific DNA-methyltransferase
MKNRLEVAKELLTEDGNIFINLDWNEVHYCKVLMDNIFGRDRFRNEIVWCYNGPGSPKMKQLNRKHDTILWYSKSAENWVFNGDVVRMESDVHVGGFNGEMGKETSADYTEKGKIPEDWWEIIYNKSDLESELRTYYQEGYVSENSDWFKAAVAARIRVDGKKRTGYLTEKPYKLIERIIKMGSNEGDLVLDFFAGSGTTGFVANYLQRRFILIEQLDSTINLLKQRFIEEETILQPKVPVYCELAQANQQLVDEIMAANEPLKLLEVWTLLQEKGFLSYKISPKLINEHAEDFNDLSLDDQKRFLIECLDKNMLYIPYSDIDDEGFTLSENDKQLTRQFYASK